MLTVFYDDTPKATIKRLEEKIIAWQIRKPVKCMLKRFDN